MPNEYGKSLHGYEITCRLGVGHQTAALRLCGKEENKDKELHLETWRMNLLEHVDNRR